MPDDLETNVRKAADQLAKALADATELTVETRYVEIGSGASEDLQNSSLIAKTVIQLDGDHTSIIPMQRSEAGNLSVDETLFDLHLRNVSTAIDYRVNTLNTLLGMLKGRGR